MISSDTNFCLAIILSPLLFYINICSGLTFMVYVAGLDYHKGEHITIHRDCCSPWRYFTTHIHLPRLALVYPIPRRNLGNLIILSTHTLPDHQSRHHKSNLHELTIRSETPIYWSGWSPETTQTHTTLEAPQRPLHNPLAVTAQGKSASCPFVT